MDNAPSKQEYLEEKQIRRALWSAERFRDFYGEDALPPVKNKEEGLKRLVNYLEEIDKNFSEGISLEEFRRKHNRK